MQYIPVHILHGVTIPFRVQYTHFEISIWSFLFGDVIFNTLTSAQVHVSLKKSVEFLLGNARLSKINLFDSFHDEFTLFHFILEILVFSPHVVADLVNQEICVW